MRTTPCVCESQMVLRSRKPGRGVRTTPCVCERQISGKNCANRAKLVSKPHNPKRTKAGACEPGQPCAHRGDSGRPSCWAVWDCLGPSGWAVWGCLGPSGAVWGRLGLSVAVWGCLGPSGGSNTQTSSIARKQQHFTPRCHYFLCFIFISLIVLGCPLFFFYV